MTGAGTPSVDLDGAWPQLRAVSTPWLVIRPLFIDTRFACFSSAAPQSFSGGRRRREDPPVPASPAPVPFVPCRASLMDRLLSFAPCGNSAPGTRVTAWVLGATFSTIWSQSLPTEYQTDFLRSSISIFRRDFMQTSMEKRGGTLFRKTHRQIKNSTPKSCGHGISVSH